MFDVRRTSKRECSRWESAGHTGRVRNAEHPDVGDLSLTSVLAAIADPVRMGLVQTLADGRELAWGELDVPVGKSTLSHHLKTLRSAGVTQTRMEGTRCYVRLRSEDLERRFPGVLASILQAVDPLPSTPQQGRAEAADSEQPSCTSEEDSGDAA